MENRETYIIGDLEFIPKEGMSNEEWLQYRDLGIGGSDISVLLGQNPYATKIQLFFQKLGLTDPPNLSENESVHSGKRFENIILEDSCYYDPSEPKAYITNFNNQTKLNNHIEFPFMVRNLKFPWLIGNVDGLGLIKDLSTEEVIGMIMSGILPDVEKIVEIKTISSQSANMWVDNIPPGYKSQVHTYALQWLPVFPDIYGEIYSKVDGVSLEYHRVNLDPALIDEILTESYEFWELVKKGKEIIANETDPLKAENLLKEISPEPDDSENYGRFLSDRYLKKQSDWDNRVKADKEILEFGLTYLELKGKEKELKSETNTVTNKIKKWMVDHDTTIVDCGDNGKITFNKRLYVNLK